MGRKQTNFLLAIIVALGAIMRFIGVNWDSGAHLHPDERFLTMVGIAMKIPATFAQYMDPVVSTMNPANIGYTFYVYGLLPLTLNKLVAVIAGTDDYLLYTLQGRLFSGVMDVVAIVIVYKIVKLIEDHYKLHHKSLKLWAAFIYAVSVLAIQLSHFFAVDTFLNTFCLISVYFILKVLVVQDGKKTEVWKVFWYAGLSGIFWGAALSSKVTAVFMVPLIAAMAFAIHQKKMVRPKLLLAAALWAGLAFLVVRIANPYMFETGNIFDLRLSSLYLKNLRELKGYENPDSFFPPIIQWANTTPVVYSFVNLFMYAYGPIAMGLTLIGSIFAFRRKTYLLWVISIYSFLFFLYQSTQVTQPVRYYNIILPYFAILAAVAIVYIGDVLRRWHLLFIPLLLVWPMAFLSIYVLAHSRITASRWIYANIPAGSVIAVEHWDDAIPISVDRNIAQRYTFSELPVFAPDTDPNKWNELYDKLGNADYYILSSNRAWRSIMNAPDKYPQMSLFYKNLFAGKNQQYQLHAHFSSFPSLRYLSIPVDFPDDKSDETFTVYDHPEIYIFRRVAE
jgi:hypothetical protein